MVESTTYIVAFPGIFDKDHNITQTMKRLHPVHFLKDHIPNVDL